MHVAKRLAVSVLSVLAVSSGLLVGCGASSKSVSASNTANSASQITGTTGHNSTGSSTSASGDKKVSIGYITWPEDVAIAQLWKYLLEQKGYTVTFTQLTPGPMYEGVAGGGVDIFNDVWLPHADASYMKRFGDKYIEAGKWFQPTREGIVVPDYVKDVNSLADLNAHAKEFDNRIVGIEPGAGETTLIQNTVIPAYGIKLKLVNSSGSGMISALQKAISEHKPVAVVLWSPYWVFAKWHLKFLNDPKDKFGDNTHPGWIENIVNKKWGEQHQQIVNWMKSSKMKPAYLNSLELDIKQASKPEDGVKKWVAANQSLVNGWMQGS